jgi:hypothetical protein
MTKSKERVAKPKPDDKKQIVTFRKAARDLGCDDNEERFKEALRKIAKVRPYQQKLKDSVKRRLG